MSVCHYKGTFKITHYCSKCNDPEDSTNMAYEKLGEPEDFYSCAVDKSLYDKYKGCIVQLEGGKRYLIHDFHRQGKKILDIWSGVCDECDCNDYSDNGDEYEGSIIED